MAPFPRSIRHAAVAGAAVLVLAGSAVGIAAAQTQPTPTPTSGYQTFIDALAKRLNISSSNLETAISQARTDAGLPAGNRFPGGPRRGPGGPGGPGFGFELNTAAQAIGISVDQLHTELAGKSLAQVAQAHGKTGADVATALKNAAHTRIDQAVTDGKLTADRANQMKSQVDTRIDQFVNQTLPQRPAGRGPGGPGGFGFPGRGFDLNTAAQAIGITADQLRTEIAGKSLAQVAQAHGKTGADVATALKNAAHTRIDQAVTDGKLTADQANQMKTKVDTRIDQLVNQVLPQGPGRRGGAGANTEVGV